MNFILKLPKSIPPYFNPELAAYKNYLRVGDLRKAWFHLECP